MLGAQTACLGYMCARRVRMLHLRKRDALLDASCICPDIRRFGNDGGTGCSSARGGARDDKDGCDGRDSRYDRAVTYSSIIGTIELVELIQTVGTAEFTTMAQSIGMVEMLNFWI